MKPVRKQQQNHIWFTHGNKIYSVVNILNFFALEIVFQHELYVQQFFLSHIYGWKLACTRGLASSVTSWGRGTGVKYQGTKWVDLLAQGKGLASYFFNIWKFSLNLLYIYIAGVNCCVTAVNVHLNFISV